MNTKKNKSKRFGRAVKIGSGFFILFSLILMPFVPLVQAANPRFNISTPYVHSQTAGRDYFLLDVKNETKGTGFNFPVAADPGDILTFSVYYHNGVNNTIANDTMVRIVFPSATALTQTVTASLWADNAENTTASNPMSQSVSVNLPQSASLQIVSSSVRWFLNQTSPLTNSPASFLSGQTGSELFGSGLNVGDIKGNWEFSGFVNFQARVVSQQISVAPLKKAVTNKNVPNGSHMDIEALPNDILQYTISYSNTTDQILNNVQIFDVLPSYVTPQDISNGGSFDSSKNQITWNIGTIGIGSSISVSYRAKVQAVSYDGFIIGNTALLRSQGMNDVVSNMTRTTVILPVVKGSTVETVTGSNSLAENFIYSLLISVAFSALLYYGLKYTDILRLLKFRFVVLKIKARDVFYSKKS